MPDLGEEIPTACDVYRQRAAKPYFLGELGLSQEPPPAATPWPSSSNTSAPPYLRSFPDIRAFLQRPATPTKEWRQEFFPAAIKPAPPIQKLNDCRVRASASRPQHSARRHHTCAADAEAQRLPRSSLCITSSTLGPPLRFPLKSRNCRSWRKLRTPLRSKLKLARLYS